MGVDCRIILPENVNVRNVANVLGRLAGLPVERHVHNPRTWWTVVNGVKVDTTSVPEMVMIRWGDRHTTYHFEYRPGGRLMLPRSTAFWIAAGNRLIEFFGGSIDWSDCDAVDVDREFLAKTRDENSPETGDAWVAFQERLLALKPLHHDEIAAMREHAAYDNDSYLYAYDSGGYLTATA